MRPHRLPASPVSSPMRLGLFGGTFDPPHVGHLALAEACREGAGLDRVVWIPAAVNPHKQGRDRTPAADRLAMVRAATESHEHFEVSDVEIAREGVSYTVDTLREIARQRPEDELFWIVGGDSLASFPTWREPEAIAALAHLVVYRRGGHDLDTGALPGWMEGRYTVVDGPALEVSSTEIRQRLAAGRSVRYLVPDPVLAIVRERGLYRTPPAPRR